MFFEKKLKEISKSLRSEKRQREREREIEDRRVMAVHEVYVKESERVSARVYDKNHKGGKRDWVTTNNYAD